MDEYMISKKVIIKQPIPDLEEIKKSKLQELSTICNNTITAGCDVTLSDSTKGHISMTDEDQINLLSALAAIKNGEAGYPYHLNGELCKIYPAADIVIIGTTATKYKIYHTTYYNHLKAWVDRCTTIEAVNAITYGLTLPEDLLANMNTVLGNA